MGHYALGLAQPLYASAVLRSFQVALKLYWRYLSDWFCSLLSSDQAKGSDDQKVQVMASVPR